MDQLAAFLLILSVARTPGERAHAAISLGIAALFATFLVLAALRPG